MGITKIHPIKFTLANAVGYITNPHKTNGGEFIKYSSGAFVNANSVEKDFLSTRAMGSGRGDVLAQHIVQSFPKSDNVTPELAMKLAQETADKLLKGNYEYIIAVHNDTDNIHAHIIFNNVSNVTYRTFETEENQGKVKDRSWKKLRKINDEVCEENNLDITVPKNKGKSYYEWSQDKKGESWKSWLKRTIDETIMRSQSFDEFIENLKKFGVTAVYTPQNKIQIKFQVFKEDGTKLTARGKTLGWYYDAPQIKMRIDRYQAVLRGTARGKGEKPKFIDTSNEYFQTSKGLLHWANIENMKRASKLINFLTTNGYTSELELETAGAATYNRRMEIVQQLDKKQNELQDVSDRLALIRTYEKYKPIHNTYTQLRESDKKKYYNSNAAKLKKYDGAVEKLTKLYPNKKLPSPKKLEEKKSSLFDEVKKLNDEFSQIDKSLREIDTARTSLQDYLKTIEQPTAEKENRHSI